MKKRIKLFSPAFDIAEEKAIQKTLKSGFWASGAGVGNVKKFEDEFNHYIKSKYCVAVNSGTAALHLALSLFDIKNCEVIVPSLSFVSTANAVIYNGGKPVFVDVDPKTLCLNPDLIEEKITKKTKVILPVHFAGMPCNVDSLLKICKKNNLALIEDAAHAVGTNYKHKKIGTHGSAVCFSFHPVKNLAMPTGGAITLNDKNSQRFLPILKSLRWCGITDRVGPKYDIKNLGWNYYMNEFSATIGIEQLKKLDKMNFTRKKIAKRYCEEISVKKKMPYDQNCSYHMYWIMVKNRNRFMKKMDQSGIETGIHYLPIHKMKYYSNKIKLPTTEFVSQKIVSLPIHPKLTEKDISKIIKLTNKFS